MSYSYPVYRLGMVFTTKETVSVKDAGDIAAQIIAHAHDWDLIFRQAAAKDNHTGDFRTSEKEKIKQRVEESYILNFPGITFRMGKFSVSSRISVTVCMHGHRSKIWLMLRCSAINGKPAVDLSAGEVERFLSQAKEKVQVIVPALAKTYLDNVRQSGAAVPESKPYYFHLRAFNSLTPSSKELCVELGKKLTVVAALERGKYRRELRDYFKIVLGTQPSPSKVRRAIKDGSLDVFGYESETHDAVFSIRIGKAETDICGYGYDKTRKVGNNLLAQATTRDLLNEYAEDF